LKETSTENISSLLNSIYLSVLLLFIVKMVRQCPKCKTNEYNNPKLKMMINECGHPLCQNCVENIFARNSARCPYDGCAKMLRKNNFWEQLFDDPMIERENFIRKRLSKTYNLQEDDFPCLRDFNDYLENIEEIIFKLMQEVDMEETETEIKRFKEQHQEKIERNRRRLNPDEIWINEMLNEETRRSKRLKEEHSDDKSHGAMANPQAIIDELRDSDLPAEVVLDRQRKIQIEAEMAEKEEVQRRKRDKMERQRRAQDVASFGPLRCSGQPYVHVVPIFALHGPKMPNAEEIEAKGYLQHVRQSTATALAGGYLSQVGCTRAIFEAHQDLFSF